MAKVLEFFKSSDKNLYSFEDLKKDFEGRSEYIENFTFLDCDDLGLVNEHFGWLAGNKAMESFCELVRKTTRNIYRIGGDEFVIVNEPKIEKLIIYINAFSEIKVSAGIIDFKMNTLDDYIEIADRFCRLAKSRGKKQYFIC